MKKRRKNVFMPLYNNEGFTLAETILSLTIITILLSISYPTIRMIDSANYYEELDVFQFLTFVENEMNSSNHVSITRENILLTDHNNRLVEIEKYRDHVRRRVDDQGHELLIQNIKDIEFAHKDNLLIIHVYTRNGGEYHKKIPLPAA
ncbi:competence type IV pilus minor pilin ComGF [Halobacillus sp. A5]|uniref:competence type IV pilus minor pilin ComGF n=1 Tax=Halobacillus sp. A5 TaxID=2880263 RepID=UPI0020A62F50|nr:competence type IV pilus minor pilin ComGF [Halobacillus sp. A5]MCP3025695.1 prepilin-type N-terminal cleavage/methylation domain-containing protein [Halobacillus sp. A5]